jgi:hypothetical protein
VALRPSLVGFAPITVCLSQSKSTLGIAATPVCGAPERLQSLQVSRGSPPMLLMIDKLHRYPFKSFPSRYPLKKSLASWSPVHSAAYR